MKTGNYIAGQWQRAKGEAFASKNPANGEVIWQGHAATTEEVSAAVAAAREAFPAWASAPFQTRLNGLMAFERELKQNKAALAELISQEVGKPLWEAATEVAGVINKLAISVEAYKTRTGSSRSKTEDVTLQVKHHPHGVLAVFAPFNFPAHVPNGHIMPALLAGNTLVVKPSELTPKVSEHIARYWEAAGLPKGVFNLVQGGAETGKALAGAPDIDGILFTGSWRTGQALSKMLADRPQKILALEMGGNNPLVVSDVDNIDAAVYQIIQSAYVTSGQRCTCTRRLIIVEQPQTDQLITRLHEVVRQLQVGPYTQTPEPFMGPVITAEAAQQLLETQEILHAQGGVFLLPMTLLASGTGLLSPGLIDMTMVTEREDKEVFGPLLQVVRVPDFEAALAEANHTQYGLSAGLLSDDKAQFEQFYQTVHAGVINWNRPTTGSSSQAPFGGLGQSGNHRPSGYYAADYCAYPVASYAVERLHLPDERSPGITL